MSVLNPNDMLQPTDNSVSHNSPKIEHRHSSSIPGTERIWVCLAALTVLFVGLAGIAVYGYHALTRELDQSQDRLVKAEKTIDQQKQRLLGLEGVDPMERAALLRDEIAQPITRLESLLTGLQIQFNAQLEGLTEIRVQFKDTLAKEEYQKAYTCLLVAGRTYFIDLETKAVIDLPALDVQDGMDSTTVTFGENSRGWLRRLIFKPRKDGAYEIVISAHTRNDGTKGGAGPYKLTVREMRKKNP